MPALWPLQVAIVARLKADAALMASVTGVFDGRALQGQAMPYVVYGSATETDGSTQAERGSQNTVLLHVWSSTPSSSKEAHAIARLVDLALRAPLALDGHTEAHLRLELAEPIIQSDGVRHIPMRYRTATFEVA